MIRLGGQPSYVSFTVGRDVTVLTDRERERSTSEGRLDGMAAHARVVSGILRGRGGLVSMAVYPPSGSGNVGGQGSPAGSRRKNVAKKSAKGMNPGQGKKVSPQRGQKADSAGGKGAGSNKQAPKSGNPFRGAQGGMRGKQAGQGKKK